MLSIPIPNNLRYKYLLSCPLPYQKGQKLTTTLRREKFEISDYELHLPVLLKTCISLAKETIRKIEKDMVKHTRYRPGVAQRVPGSQGSQIS